MPRLPITSLFAALLALLLFTLTMTVIVTRMTTKTDLGDGDNPLMFRRIRAHGNFVEYVPMGQWANGPMGLILLGLNEISGAGAIWLWTIGALLLVGRILHAAGMIFTISPSRVIGTMLTNWSLLLSAVLLLIDVLGCIRSSSPTGGI
jgi:uncharacterized membrane protein YecN with MAPEG domain